MSNAKIIKLIAAALAEAEYQKRDSTAERKDKLTAVCGHLEYALQRMESKT